MLTWQGDLLLKEPSKKISHRNFLVEKHNSIQSTHTGPLYRIRATPTIFQGPLVNPEALVIAAIAGNRPPTPKPKLLTEPHRMWFVSVPSSGA